MSGQGCCSLQRHLVTSHTATLLYAPDHHPWHLNSSHRVCVNCRQAGTSVIVNNGSRQAADHILTADAAAHFKPGSSTAVDDANSPWSVGWHMRERNIMWNDELKMRLIKHIASQKMGIDAQEFEDRLHTLYILLPDLASRLLQGPPDFIVQLGSSIHTIADRLLRLREILPKADISHLVASRLTLLLEEDLEMIQAVVDRLRVLLPNILVDRFIEAYPQVLDIDDFEMAIKGAKVMMPKIDVAQTLRNNPDLILSLQKGRHLIPYELPNE